MSLVVLSNFNGPTSNRFSPVLRSIPSLAFFLLALLFTSAAHSACGNQLTIPLNLYSPKTDPPLTIQTNLCLDGPYKLRVFNHAGEMIRELRNVKVQLAGMDWVDWDGKNENGDEIASGVYIIRMEIDASILTARVAVIK